MITTQMATSFPVVHRRPPPSVIKRRYPLLQRWFPPVRIFVSLAVNNKAGSGKGMSWFYEMEEEVREYELDQYGVVNNAIYSNYWEYATHKLVGEIGFDASIKLAVSEASIKYIAPLKAKDRYLIKLRIYDYSTARLYFEYQIFKLPNHEPIARATAILVTINERLRPCCITTSMISTFNRFLLTRPNH